MTRFLVGLGLACAVVAAAARADDATELRWRFKKGQTFAYLLKHREVRTVEVGDTKFETTTNSEYEWEWTVRETDSDGVATLDLKLKALRVNSTGKEFDFQYDSAKATESADDFKKKLANFYDQLRFGKYRLRLKPDGRIAEVYGFDKLLNEVTPGTQVAEFYGYNLRDESIGWFMQLALGVLPDRAAKPGDKWKVPAQAKWAGLGEVTGQTEWALDKPVKVGDRMCQQLKADGSETMEVDMRWGDAPLRGTLKTSKLTGTVKFDANAGAVQASEVRAEFAGDLKWGEGDNPLVLKTTFRHTLELEAKP
jgi:Family of unknown function (DUF6263)